MLIQRTFSIKNSKVEVRQKIHSNIKQKLETIMISYLKRLYYKIFYIKLNLSFIWEKAKIIF